VGLVRIVFEDVSEDFALTLTELLAAHGHTPVTVEHEWTPARAEALLRDLPERAVQIIRVTVDGDGWGPAGELRGTENASLRGRSGAIAQAVKRGIRAGRFPDGLPVPVSAQYDPNNQSYQRTAGYVMAEEHLPAFRAALARL
jgi:hypothetical protein